MTEDIGTSHSSSDLLRAQIAALLEQAIRSEFGIAIKTNNPELAKVRLVNAMNGKKEYSGYLSVQVAMRKNTQDSEVWILKKKGKIHAEANKRRDEEGNA